MRILEFVASNCLSMTVFIVVLLFPVGLHVVTRHSECQKDDVATRLMDNETVIPRIAPDNSNFRCAETCSINVQSYLYCSFILHALCICS